MESRALLHARPAALLPPRAGLRLPLPLPRPRAVSLSPAAKPALQSPLLASRGPFLPRHDAVLGNGFLKRRAASAGGDVSFRAQAAAASAAVPAPAPQPEESSTKFLGIDVKTLKKIVPLGLMFFCILFNYTILRDTKDVLVVTAKGSSAEIIPFLKTWVNLPMAIGFMLLYTKLSNVLSREALFYTVIFPFIAFFGAFAFVLYPLRDVIHPTALADKLLAALGPSYLGPVAILRIWSFCLFYVMAELWGSVVISVLFWGFANQVKGKAAIDVVCNPLGKSGGALIQQFMILTFGSLANSTPYLGGILLVTVLAWLGAASSLDKQFSSLAKEDLKKEKPKRK